MVQETLGLDTSSTTWMLALMLFVLWLVALPLLVRLRGGWERLLVSLLGLAWLSFGLEILVRFQLLSYDAVTYASSSTRLIDRSSAAVDLALVTAGVYWVAFVVAGALVVRVLPIPSLLTRIVSRGERARSLILPGTAACCVCIAASLYPGTPTSLVTPLALLGSMWVLPAAIAWTPWWTGGASPAASRLLVFAPAALRLVLSPYREHALVAVLLVLTGALLAGRRIRFLVTASAAVLLLLFSTIAVDTYRLVLWSNLAPEDAVSRISVTNWVNQPFTAPWLENLRRFHAFDSLLLTVDLVPTVFPFTERNLVVEGVTRAVVPRLFDPDKARSSEGERFQVLFWAFDDDPRREGATAAIAPSMPGSLYEAGGIAYAGVGGAIWGLLLAFVDRVKLRVGPVMATALHVVCAAQALGGIERDYALAVSTLVQTLIVFAGVCLLIAPAARASYESARAESAAA